MTLDQLFIAALTAGLLTFGGLGSLPVLRNALSSADVPVDTLILNSLAVGYIAPGPNGLYIIAAGYFIAGVPGALVVTLAVFIPPLIVLVLDAVRERLIHLRRFQGAIKSLGLAVVGVLASSSGTLAVHASVSVLTVAMVVLGAVALLRGIPPVLAMLAAIAIGLVMSL